MAKTKKFRCPHCKAINVVDVKEELDENEMSGMRVAGGNKIIIDKPEYITITCSNPECEKPFKIPVG